MMKQFIYIILLSSIFFSCQDSSEEKTPMNNSTTVSPQKMSGNLSDSTFQTEVGWGYDIKRNGKTYIHQPHIPSIGGHQGFSTQEKAQKAASFVKYKIENNIMPPSVSPAELDSIGVLD